MGTLLTLTVRALAASALLSLAGCGKPARTTGQSDDVLRRDVPPIQSATATRSVEQRRAELLNRIRAADPDQKTIERALINEHNELGLILNRQANLDDVPKLMRAMLTQMAESFPGQDLTAVAYTPTNPPRTIGTGRLNARTRDMTYTPASPR